MNDTMEQYLKTLESHIWIKGTLPHRERLREMLKKKMEELDAQKNSEPILNNDEILRMTKESTSPYEEYDEDKKDE